MSSSHVCPCCFLNRISSLRNTPELINQEAHSHSYLKDFTTATSSNNYKVNAPSSGPNKRKKDSSKNSNLDHSSVSLVTFDNGIKEGESCNFMYPERLVNKSGMFQSSETFTIEESNRSSSTDGSKTGPCASVDSRDKTAFLADQIDCMLQEQRKFLRELELPIYDEGGFRLKEDELIEVEVTNEGDSIKVNRKVTSKANEQKKERKKKTITGRFTNEGVYFASGDQGNALNVKDGKSSSDDTLSVPLLNDDKVNQFKKNKKFKGNFKEEPVKLSKNIEWATPLQTNFDLNKDSKVDKTISVKMIFRPEGELICSTSSIESLGEAKSVATASSAYVTAVNSNNDCIREFNTNEGIYTIAGSSSNLLLNITHSE